MANQHKEKLRGVRGISDQLWEDFETATNQTGSDRSAAIRRYIEWYCHRPGAQLPERPEPPTADAAP